MWQLGALGVFWTKQCDRVSSHQRLGLQWMQFSQHSIYTWTYSSTDRTMHQRVHVQRPPIHWQQAFWTWSLHGEHEYKVATIHGSHLTRPAHPELYHSIERPPRGTRRWFDDLHPQVSELHLTTWVSRDTTRYPPGRAVYIGHDGTDQVDHFQCVHPTNQLLHQWLSTLNKSPADDNRHSSTWRLQHT